MTAAAAATTTTTCTMPPPTPSLSRLHSHAALSTMQGSPVEAACIYPARTHGASLVRMVQCTWTQPNTTCNNVHATDMCTYID